MLLGIIYHLIQPCPSKLVKGNNHYDVIKIAHFYTFKSLTELQTYPFLSKF